MTNTETNNKPLKVAVGTDNFKRMVTEYDVFVDKTLFIKEIIDSSEEAMLITYPRRWGKTLNLDMLKTFFEPESEKCQAREKAEILQKHISQLKQEATWYDSWWNPWSSLKNLPELDLSKLNAFCNRDIFQKLKISSATCSKKNLKIGTTEEVNCIDGFQGNYPVIFISLKDVVGDSKEDVESALKLKVSNTFGNYEYLIEQNSIFKQHVIDKFQRHIEQSITQKELKDSIRFLSELLHKHHGQRVYILVDEYDKPVNSLLEDYLGQEKTPEKAHLIKDIAGRFISETICSVGKTNPSLEKLIMAGIFDTAQKELGSGCNNIEVFGITNPKFSQFFGFSQDELNKIVTQFGFDQTLEQQIVRNIKEWYNGYSVPLKSSQNVEVYNPKAVMKYLSVAQDTKDYTPDNYWIDSGSSAIFKNLYIEEVCSGTTLSSKLQGIVMGDSISLEFDPKTSLYKYYVQNLSNKEILFSYLLLNSGYLTVDKEYGTSYFKAPNAEVRAEFGKVTREQKEVNCKNHEEILNNIRKKEHVDIFEAIKEQDIEKLKEIFKQNPALQCDDKDLNFNYFHIAAIVGNKGVFSFLAEQCDKALLYVQDKTFVMEGENYGLRPIEYAYLSNSADHIISVFPIKPEEFFKDIVPEAQPIVDEVYISSNSPKFLGYKFEIMSLNFYCRIIKQPSFDAIKLKTPKFFDTIVSVTVNFDKLNSICETSYDKYDKIQINEEESLGTPVQFVKYKYEKEATSNAKNYYVTLDSTCRHQDKEISKIETPIYKNLYHDALYYDEVFTFYLCEEQSAKIEL